MAYGEMTIRIGVNAHPPKLPKSREDSTGASLVVDLGAELVRFPPWKAPHYAPWTSGGRYDFQSFIDQAGCDTLLVLDDAVHGWKRKKETWVDYYRRLRREFPTVTNWQVLNEPDGQPGSASGPHPPEEVSWRLRDARLGLGDDVTLWAPGCGPNYLERVDLGPVDVVAAHVYGLTPTKDWPHPDIGFGDLESYLADYQQFGKPVALSEIGGESDLFDSESQRAEWGSRVIEVAAAAGVQAILWYCLTARQCGNLALLDQHNVPLETWAAWKNSH